MTSPALTSVTAGGLPYPESTADLNQGANDIKALALALDQRGGGLLIQSGENMLTFTGATASLVFPTPFKAGTTPRVIPTGGSGSTPNNTLPAISIDNPSATGCQVHAVRVSGIGAASVWVSNGEQMRVAWIALGVAP